MNNSRADDDAPGAGSNQQSGHRPKSIDGGDPTVSARGDDKKTLLNRWGQRAVHVLMVVIPGALVLGILLEWLGVNQQSMEFAMTFVGLTLTVTGLLAVVIVLYESFRKSRQTELSEFESYR